MSARRLLSATVAGPGGRVAFVSTCGPARAAGAAAATSAANPPSGGGHTVSPELAAEIEQCYARLDPTFRNTQEAFKSKANTDLVRAMAVLKVCGIQPLVKHNMKLLAVMRRVLGQSMFKKVLKSTFYGQFVAGENQQEVQPVVTRLKQFGVKSILDYSVEADLSSEEAQKKTVQQDTDAEVTPKALTETGLVQAATLAETRERYSVHEEFADRRQDAVVRTFFYESERQCDVNRDIFMQSVDAVAAATGGEGFAAIKITALGRPALLLKLSECIAQTHNFFRAVAGDHAKLDKVRITGDDFKARLKELGVKTDSAMVQKWFATVDFDNDGQIDFHGWDQLLDENAKLGQMFQVLNIKTGKLEPLIQNLTDEEEIEFRNMARRCIEIANYSIKKGVRLMVDAEQTYFQPAISRMAIAMMRKYNKERGNIFNTYQAYLKNTLKDMECDMQLARREGWHFGAKLVRGAYMEQERKRAETIGYEDPVNPDFDATSRMYEQCLTRLVDELERRGRGHVSVMAASHNEDTVRFGVNLMRDRSIAPSEKIICFAQLYGMCDQISFSLGQAGYSVYKYLPYGPVEEVLPYLSRRAIENGSLLKLSGAERALLWKELIRRIQNGQFTYKTPQ